MKKLLGLISFLLVLAGSVSAKVVLPAIFSDNMVLQQNAQVNLWGKATPGERVSVKASWTDKTVTTKAAADGKWTVKLKTPAAAKGQSVTVSGENTITINNVLVGEVWLCTGQSNMEYPVSRHPDKMDDRYDNGSRGDEGRGLSGTSSVPGGTSVGSRR